MSALEVFILGFMVLCLYLTMRFYWLRVTAIFLLFALWTSVAVVAPIYFLVNHVANGRIVEGILLIIGSSIVAMLWFIGFKSARKWVANEISLGRWTKMPWNAR